MRKILTVVLFILVPLASFAQNEEGEFGLWTAFSATKKINSHLNIDGELEFRAQDNLESVDSWRAGLGVDYKLIKGLKFGLSYTYIYAYNIERWKIHWDEDEEEYDGYNVFGPYWVSKHRGCFDVTGSRRIGRLKVALRERLQYTYNGSTTTWKRRMRYNSKDSLVYKSPKDITDSVKTNEAKKRWILRSRLEVSYSIPAISLEPFISYEFYNSLQDGFDIDKTRLSVGAEYDINKSNSLSLIYRYVNSRDVKDVDRQVLCLNYDIKF